MSSFLSVPEILARLEAQIAVLRDKEAFHAGQEAFHREQRTAFGAELAEATRRFEAFKASAAEALDFASRATDPGAQQEEIVINGRRPKLPRLVVRVIEDVGEIQHFGPGWVAAEINRRFGKSLRRPTNRRLVSIVLRRMADRGQIHIYRLGRPHNEARYTRRKVETA